MQELTESNVSAAQAAAFSYKYASGGSIDSKINNGVKLINKWNNYNVTNQREAKTLLKDMLRNKLIYQIGNDSKNAKYGTNYPDLITEILSKKSSNLTLIFGNPNPDIIDKSILYFFDSNASKVQVHKDYSFDFNETHVSELGKSSLGYTLMDLSNTVDINSTNQTVEMISEKIAREVILNGKISGEQVRHIFNDYKSLFENLLEKTKQSGSDSKTKHIQAYIDNWTHLESMVLNSLKARVGLSVKEGATKQQVNDTSKSSEENFNQNNDMDADGEGRYRTNYLDNFSITLNHKDTLSTRLKLFLSLIPSPSKVHYITKSQLYEKFDTMYETLSSILSDIEPSYKSMMDRLNEYKPIYPWIESLQDKLHDADEHLAREFVTSFNKHYINMMFINASQSRENNMFKVGVWEDNANSIRMQTLENWAKVLLISLHISMR